MRHGKARRAEGSRGKPGTGQFPRPWRARRSPKGRPLTAASSRVPPFPWRPRPPANGRARRASRARRPAQGCHGVRERRCRGDGGGRRRKRRARGNRQRQRLRRLLAGRQLRVRAGTGRASRGGSAGVAPLVRGGRRRERPGVAGLG